MQTSVSGTGYASATRGGNGRLPRLPELRRRHERIRLPAAIELGVQGGRRLYFRVNDLSEGGLSFSATNVQTRVGSVFSGHLSVQAGPVAIAIPVTFQVRNREPRTGRVGCSFQALGPTETVVLRRVVMAVRDGNAIDVTGLLLPAHRNNVNSLVIPRRPRSAATAGRGRRSSGLTLLAFLLIVAGAGYSLQLLPGAVFATRTPVAMVSGPGGASDDAHVVAHFRPDQADRVTEGAAVRFRTDGDVVERAGRIVQVTVLDDSHGPGSYVIAIIEPVEPLPADRIGHPVEVRVGGTGFGEQVTSIVGELTGGY